MRFTRKAEDVSHCASYAGSMTNYRFLSLLLTLLIVGAACGSASTSGDTNQADQDQTATSVAPTTIAPEVVTTTAAPSTTVVAPTTASTVDPAAAEPEPITIAGVRDQIIGWMGGDGMLTADEYERIFSAEFRAEASVDEVNSLWPQTSPLGPWKVIETFEESAESGRFLLEGNVPEPKVMLSIEMGDGQVTGALVQPWSEAPETFDDAVASVEALGQTSYLIAETTSGSCVPVVDSGADEIIPIGSIFKVIVLGAVIDAVGDGVIAWETDVQIRDELDSYPSGTTQDVAAGTMMTVRALADLMISISDNTATDHLIDLVGRDAVEAAQAKYGIGQPELNIPFLTTRELFQIKLDPDLRARYVAADQQTRRGILDEVAEIPLAPVEEAVAGWIGPIELDNLEWFATPADLCRALVAVSADPEAASILQVNPGIPDESARWESIGYKGGSEPGLLAVGWIVTDAEGRTFTITGAAVSSGLIDPIAGVTAFAGMRDSFVKP